MRNVILEQIQISKCVIVIWSKISVESTWVKGEAQEGYDLGKLIPAMIDDVRSPLGMRDLDEAKLFPWPSSADSDEMRRFLNAVEKKAGDTLYKRQEQLVGDVISEMKNSHFLISKKYFWVAQFSMFIIACTSILALVNTLENDKSIDLGRNGYSNESYLKTQSRRVRWGRSTWNAL